MALAASCLACRARACGTITFEICGESRTPAFCEWLPAGAGAAWARSQAAPHARSQRRPRRPRSERRRCAGAAAVRVRALASCRKLTHRRRCELWRPSIIARAAFDSAMMSAGFHPRGRMQIQSFPDSSSRTILAASARLATVTRRNRPLRTDPGPASATRSSSGQLRRSQAPCAPCLGESATGTHGADQRAN